MSNLRKLKRYNEFMIHYPDRPPVSQLKEKRLLQHDQNKLEELTGIVLRFLRDEPKKIINLYVNKNL